MSHTSLTKWDAVIALSLGGLMIAHYGIHPRVLWVHVLLFWLFQVPILIGSLTRGVRGGLGVRSGWTWRASMSSD
jgi:hypothetical protein